jgi:hypothetical protein
MLAPSLCGASTLEVEMAVLPPEARDTVRPFSVVLLLEVEELLVPEQPP